MSANAQTTGIMTTAPIKGERCQCKQCGMEIEVTTVCPCPNAEHVHFQCCDQEMARVAT